MLEQASAPASRPQACFFCASSISTSRLPRSPPGGLSYALLFPLALVYIGLGTTIMAQFGPIAFGGMSLAISMAGIFLASLFPR
jgi:hypothetical protein